MQIEHIGVIGAGTMGNGIAQVCAMAGVKVTMVDINDAAVQRGLGALAGSLDRLVKKDKLTQEGRDAALALVKGTTRYEDLVGTQLVIEAATENLELKLRILTQLDSLVGPETVIATNTSSISITQLAAVLKQPTRVIGLHFFNPVPLMALV
jgi:3-hydroxybutyryl-CoA dehydrogenase